MVDILKITKMEEKEIEKLASEFASNNQLSNGFYTLLPDVYPTNLQECLIIFENIRYKSYGFGMVFLDYNYTFKCWSMAFRNAANFTNPDIKAKTPIEAAYQMLDFLKTLKTKG